MPMAASTASSCIGRLFPASSLHGARRKHSPNCTEGSRSPVSLPAWQAALPFPSLQCHQSKQISALQSKQAPFQHVGLQRWRVGAGSDGFNALRTTVADSETEALTTLREAAVSEFDFLVIQPIFITRSVARLSSTPVFTTYIHSTYHIC